MYYLYILKCQDQSLYAGITTDIDRRLAKHNSGKGSKYTRGRLPCELVYSEFCRSRSAASKREAEIKSLTRQQKLLLINNQI